MFGRLRGVIAGVVAGAVVLGGVAWVPARAATGAQGVAVSAPVRPQGLSSGLPLRWRPPMRPTQAAGSQGDARHRELARMRALVAANNTRPHPVSVLPPVLAAAARWMAQARARGVIGRVVRVRRLSPPGIAGGVVPTGRAQQLPTWTGPRSAPVPQRAFPAAKTAQVPTASEQVRPLSATSKVYGATYSTAGAWDTPPSYSSPGLIQVTVTNTGNFNWPSDGSIGLGYHLWTQTATSSGTCGFSNVHLVAVNCNGVSTAVTVTVNQGGGKVTLSATVQQLPAGSYYLVWDMMDSTANNGNGPYYFSAYGVPTSQAIKFTVPHYAPTAQLFYPLDNGTVATLNPQLEAYVNSDGTLPNQAEFTLCEGGSPCWNSGWLNVSHTTGNFSDPVLWSPPAGALFWNRTYNWRLQVRDTSVTGPTSPLTYFSTAIPPPAGANLGVDPSAVDAAGVNLFLGSYTRHETDLSLPAGGLPLGMDRYYNSGNTGYGPAFGPGWSSVLDMNATVASDGTVTVTFADGRQVSYRQNPDSSWAPSSGESGEARLTIGPNGYQVQTGGLTYAFKLCLPVGLALSQISGPAGAVDFNFDAKCKLIDAQFNPRALAGQTPPPGRALYVNWNVGESEVQSISASPVNTPGAPVWTYSYNSSYQLSKVCDPTQACTSYGYTGGALTSVTRPDQAPTTVNVSYSGGHVLQVAYPAWGPSAYWSYARSTPQDNSPASLLVHVIDPNAHPVDYEFYSDGRLYRRYYNDQPLAQNSKMWAYDGAGQLAEVTDENGNSINYSWWNSGQLASTWTARGSGSSQTLQSTSYSYWFQGPLTDPRYGQVTAVQDPRLNTTTTTYTDGSVPGVIAGLMASRTLPATTAPSGATTTYTYTCQNGTEPVVVNDPAAPTAVQPCGLLASVTDPAGHVTRYGYNHYGDQTQVTSPSGQVTNQFYDPWGCVTEKLVVTPTNTTGAETDYTCDGDRRVKTETGPAVKNPVTGVTHQLQVVNTYDGDGNLVQSVSSDLTGGDPARTWTYGYDGQDHQTSQTINGTTVSKTSYDVLGNETSYTDGNGNVFQYGYDDHERLSYIWLLNYVDDPGSGSTTPRTVPIHSYSYDYAGRLGNVTDSMGNTVYYTYTGDNLLVTETLYPVGGPANGIVTHTYSYDNAGNMTGDTQDAGGTTGTRTTTWTYDNANQPLTQTVDPGGLNRVTSWTYDAAGNQTGTSLVGGGRTESSSTLYNSAGQVWETVVHNDATPDLVTEYSRDASGQVLASTDPRGTAAAGSTTAPDPAFTTTNTYDALERLSTTTAPPMQAEDGTGSPAVTVSPTTTYGYDTFGDLTDVKDPRGLVIHTAYDALGRKTEMDYPSYTSPGATAAITPQESWNYDGNGNVLSHTDRAGQTTTYKYDMRNRCYLVTLPPATTSSTPGTFQYVYDDNGNLRSAIDPAGAQVLYTYDKGGYLMTSLTQVVRNGTATPNQYTTSYTYDDYGEPIKIATADATETRGYNQAGELISDQVTGRGTISYTYDAAGRMTKVTDPLGRYVITSYDLAGRRVKTVAYSTTGTAQATTSYTNGLGGNVTAVTDPNGNVWQASYDAANRLVSLTDPAPETATGTQLPAPVTTIGYDAAGNQTRVTDARGNTTYQTYNTLGLPETLTEPATTAQPSATDRTWVTSYDAAGHPVKTTEPGGVTITDYYDNLGNLTGQQGTGGDASATRTFGYNADRRLTSASAPAGTQTFSYDDRGLLTASSGPEGAASYTYDAEGRLKTQNDAAGSLSYTYSGALDVGTVTDSLSGLTTTYTRDTAGQVKTAADTVTATGTAAATRTYGYDDLGRLTSDITTGPTGTTTASLTYGYDPNGNLTSQVSSGQLASPHAQTNVYDADNRLIRAVNTTAATGTDYGYDQTGNRTSLVTWTGTQSTHTTTGTTTASYDQRNRALQVTAPNGTTAYTWTPRGTLATTNFTPTSGIGGITWQKFDAFDQLVNNNGQAYSYDALGRLATVTPSGGTASTFSYAGLGAEPVSDGTSLIARAYDGTPLAAKTSGITTSLLQDVHGNVIAALASGTGTVTASRAYDPFGATTATTGTPSNLTALGYQGSWTDAATGLAHAETRWYNPATGAFTSQDTATVPLTSATGANSYLYAGANPTTNNDPTGQFSWSWNPWKAVDEGLQLSERALSVGGRFLLGAAETAGGDIAGATEAAIPVAQATAEGLACVVGCDVLAAGAVIVVAVVGTGALIYAVVNSNGTLTPHQPAGCGPDPNTGAIMPCMVPGTPGMGSPQRSAIAPDRQTLAQRAPPPHVVAIRTTWDTRAWSTITRWWDDTYLYIRTDHWTLTTKTTTTYMSRGTPGTDTWTWLNHTWDILRKLLVDLSHPITLPTPKPGPATQPTLPVSASDTSTCGQGGSGITCARPNGALPSGAIPDQTPPTQTSGSGAGQGNNGGGTLPPAACPGPSGDGGEGDWVDPQTINFSQRTVSAHDYAQQMRQGQWDWNRPGTALRVIEVNGQLVTYDNRRLDAAREVGDLVRVQRVNPNDPFPGSTTGKTWWDKFKQRFNDPRNLRAGGCVPDTGLYQQPNWTSGN